MMRAAPTSLEAHSMRAWVLSGQAGAWEVGPRSTAELDEASGHFDRVAALTDAPAMKADYASNAATCRRWAEAM